MSDNDKRPKKGKQQPSFVSYERVLLHWTITKMRPSLIVAQGLAVACAHLVGRASSFAVGVHPGSAVTSRSLSAVALAAKRAKKESMSEKRARRQSRQQRTLDFPERPKLRLVEEESPPASSEASVDTTAAAAAKTTADSPMSKAQKLLATQRRSVAMLTLVKERIDQIPAADLTQALSEQGYYVCDNFLNDDETLEELQAEAVVMLDKGSLTPDMDNLASGEYVGPVQGGEEQYQICPRSIEVIVSTTKHFGALVASSDLDLDDKKCMGCMRTYDRQAFQAAKDLLTADGDEGSPSDDAEHVEKAFECLVSLEDASDQRRLSLRYYLVPSEWRYGGGTEFETGGLVPAQRDRLVIWKSAATPVRSQGWEGDDAHRYGSCLELDLLQKVV